MKKKILIISFILISIIAITSMITMLFNINRKADAHNSSISISKSGSFLSASNTGKSITGTSGDISKSEIEISPAAKSAISIISESPDDKDTEKGEYIPLAIEPAKTDKVIQATIEFFRKRLPSLRTALERSEFYYSEKLLDPKMETRAFILAVNENYAQNLNGYFYYLIDEKGSATIVSPFVLNISILFDEEDRDAVIASGDYAETKHIDALKNSLEAALGEYYKEEVFDFIFSEYKKTFKDRIEGEPLQSPIVKFKISDLEIIFHNSFLTYIEFFIDK
ncbi:MAG: hypothetical protein ACYCYI_13705 [Saccharofermentanales bacterium]